MPRNARIGISNALAECVDAMMQGKDVSFLLKRHSRHAQRLQELLSVAAMVSDLPKEVIPSPAFIRQTKGLITKRNHTEGGDA